MLSWFTVKPDHKQNSWKWCEQDN